MFDTTTLAIAGLPILAAYVVAKVSWRRKMWRTMIGAGVALVVTGWAWIGYAFVTVPKDPIAYWLLMVGAVILFPLLGGMVIARARSEARLAKL